MLGIIGKPLRSTFTFSQRLLTATITVSQPIVEIAENHGKTPAQVVLRWHIEHGSCAIPSR